MVNPDVFETAKIHPSNGAYRVTSVGADGSPTYPDNGRGAKTTTIGNAHWTDLGLAAGGFCVMIHHVTSPSGTTITLAELGAGGTSQIFVGGSPNALVVPIRMEGGFAFQTSAGGFISYTIHEYRQPTT